MFQKKDHTKIWFALRVLKNQNTAESHREKILKPKFFRKLSWNIKILPHKNTCTTFSESGMDFQRNQLFQKTNGLSEVKKYQLATGRENRAGRDEEKRV